MRFLIVGAAMALAAQSGNAFASEYMRSIITFDEPARQVPIWPAQHPDARYPTYLTGKAINGINFMSNYGWGQQTIANGAMTWWGEGGGIFLDETEVGTTFDVFRITLSKYTHPNFYPAEFVDARVTYADGSRSTMRLEFDGLDTRSFNLGLMDITSLSLEIRIIQGFSIEEVEVGASVPEPATWAMMIAGFGLVGASLRRSQPRPALSGQGDVDAVC